MIRAFILAVALGVPWGANAVDLSGTITILEGDALVYRAAAAVHAVEGMRLSRGDIVEIAASAFAQIEFTDQSIAQFGPATRAMINTSAERQKPERWLYLMDGWIKLSGGTPAAAAGAAFELRSPLIGIPANSAVVVLRHAASDVSLFVERGELRLAERQSSGAPVTVPLKAGDFYTRKQGSRGTVTSRAAPAFVTEMPRNFRDSLPSRLERFRDRPVQPVDAPGFAYADVERWLKAEPAVRRPLVQRWRAKAREPAFRSALIANLSAHPEWDPILFPEKYRPKNPAPPHAALAVGRPASAASSAVLREVLR